MNKFSIIQFTLMCLLLTGCSLGPSAASRSYKAFNAGKYEESLRLTNRAIATYEYTDEDKANLLFLKANSYAKLQQTYNAMGVLLYIVETYPKSEAAFRAKALLSALKKGVKQTPKKNKQPPKEVLINT